MSHNVSVEAQFLSLITGQKERYESSKGYAYGLIHQTNCPACLRETRTIAIYNNATIEVRNMSTNIRTKYSVQDLIACTHCNGPLTKRVDTIPNLPSHCPSCGCQNNLNMTECRSCGASIESQRTTLVFVQIYDSPPIE